KEVERIIVFLFFILSTLTVSYRANIYFQDKVNLPCFFSITDNYDHFIRMRKYEENNMECLFRREHGVGNGSVHSDFNGGHKEKWLWKENLGIFDC
ncbi:TPA: hypothetical protein ACGO5P_001280, partial [Streptococcus suis]